MRDQKYRVSFSKSFLEFTLPPTMQATGAVSQPAEPLVDLPRVLNEVLAHPVGASPMRELARRGQRVCIVFTDITRARPDQLLVPALLSELEATARIYVRSAPGTACRL